MLKEIAGLGFEWVELSHGVRITLVPGILRALEEGIIKVASCHNFCPLPAGVYQSAPNLYMPSDRDSRERSQWMRHSIRSLDFARQVRATRLVLHLGMIDPGWLNPARKVEKYLARNPRAARDHDPEYERLLARSVARLRDRMKENWELTRQGMAALAREAAARGVRLAVENREHLDELPLDEDHGELLRELARPDAVGYWHDTGHAHIKENMGRLQHQAHLEKNAEHLLGFHLHDVGADGRDHRAIGSGEIDFAMVSQFWRPEHALVIELSPRVSPEDVVRSRERIQALAAARFGA